MPVLVVDSSPDISILDSKIIVDLCLGKFFVDITPSTFVAGGAARALGVRVKIVNPFNVKIKDYGVGYDIPQPFTGNYSLSVPTQAGGYQTGIYQVYVQITDSDNKKYELVKSVSVCQPNAANKLLKYAVLGVKMGSLCNEGKLLIQVDALPVYNGIISDTDVKTLTLEYPTGSGLPPLDISAGNFTTYLFDGIYKFYGDVCGHYSGEDNISHQVPFKIKVQKEIKCTIDECCVLQKLVELHERISSDCSQKDKEETASITVDVLRLLTTAKMAIACGEDASEYITELEGLLGCRCTVDNDGTPITNVAPTSDFIINGCNVEKDESGFTTTYTINNYIYNIGYDDNGGILTVSAATIDGCVVTQKITFSIQKAYTQIKVLANDATEAKFWASVVNLTLSAIDPTSLGLTAIQWTTLTLAQKFEKVVTAISNCCACDAAIDSSATEVENDDVTLSWAGNYFGVDVFIDDTYYTTILSPATSVILSDLADAKSHRYTLVPKCSNGKYGEPVIGNFKYFGCPFIATPNLSATTINNALCPFDLTGLLTSIPNGVTVEWHNADDTSANSLVSDPQSAGSGTYYAFAKNSNGCYSDSVMVNVLCPTQQQCSAPQNVGVQTVAGGFLVFFQSAAFPPPSNSYTVKRKLTSDPDVVASYTTIGSTGSGGVVWNAGMNRWEILDNTAVDNTAYTYIVISNCGATQPYAGTEFSNYPSCPVVTGLNISIQ